ncbi:ferredoxin reductase [Streptomyces sp. NPDC003758]|uniref:Ferredoxin reductase n=1 Tax=Streptomyces cynarae TaxID=2981134 RepID=A0ABY6DTH3_9ACTN|nr:ferredoxin reductase [Streptomyces cynarae]UXY17671.1 ferredoxin reductase [Streptomyces cynarae]
MARTAVSRRLGDRLRWRVAEVTERRAESATAVTLVLEVPEWPGHLAGQHVDIRLTAEDGYSTQRSYSIASAPDGTRLELTVQRVVEGEVSPYLVDELMPGDQLELRGPVGGWFVWQPEQEEPVLLVAGGSGLVPLMCMIRSRRAAGSRVPFRVLYSLRSPAELLYGPEIRQGTPGVDLTHIYTREAPQQSARPPGRITPDDLARHGWPPDFAPTCYVCGPTAFVEKAAAYLVLLGHDPERVRTERFGGGED